MSAEAKRKMLNINAAYMKKDASIRNRGKKSVERAYIHVILEDISVSQDTEMPY
jgi:hypothetical protein